MVGSEHPEVIQGRQQLIATEVLDPEEAAEDGYIDNYGAVLDLEDESDSGEAGMRTGVTEVVTKEVEEVHNSVKYLLKIAMIKVEITRLICA